MVGVRAEWCLWSMRGLRFSDICAGKTLMAMIRDCVSELGWACLESLIMTTGIVGKLAFGFDS